MSARAETELARLAPSPTIVERVRHSIRQSLPGRLPALPAVAASCAMGRAKLQRQLAAAGTSFKTLVDEVRREMAERLLADPDHGIGEIGFALDFADSAAFHRAYKRWTGLTPSQARQR